MKVTIYKKENSTVKMRTIEAEKVEYKDSYILIHEKNKVQAIKNFNNIIVE
jgi:hypothetical protein